MSTEELVPRLDLTGWGPQDQALELKEKHYAEQSLFEKFAESAPHKVMQREPITIPPGIWDKYTKFLDSKGYGKGSVSLIQLDEFCRGRKFNWLPQKTGSCVMSNSFRLWVRRCLFECLVLGQAEELLGTNEFGKDNLSFYAPVTYGFGRRRGNMKGGDGSWCSIQYDAFCQDGVVKCNNAKLLSILTKYNAVGEHDFPEPQDNNVYRMFQNWQYLDDLKPEAGLKLMETVKLTDIATDRANLLQFKGSSMCSSIALKKVGTHKDGFDIYAQDRANRWDHNMSKQGLRIASDGKEFIEVSNESWGPNYIYNVPIEEVDRWYKAGMLETQTIGEIDLDDTPMAQL